MGFYTWLEMCKHLGREEGESWSWSRGLNSVFKGSKEGNISNSSISSKAYIFLCYLGGTICFPRSLWGGMWFGTQSRSETNSELNILHCRSCGHFTGAGGLAW